MAKFWRAVLGVPLAFVLVLTGGLTLDAGASTTFTTLFSSSALGWSEGMAVNGGNLYAASYANQAVIERAADGTISTVATTPGNPKGLAFDAQGNLYMSVQGGCNCVYVESAAQLASGVTASPGSGLVEVLNTGCYGAGGLAFNTSGDLAVSMCPGGVSEILGVSAATLRGGSFPLGPGANGYQVIARSTDSSSTDVTFDSTGNLLFTNASSLDGVSAAQVANALAGGGAAVPVSLVAGSVGLSRPVGVKAEPNGNVIVADDNTGLVSELSGPSVQSALFGGAQVSSSNVTPLTTITPMGMQLASLAVDSRGLIYVGDGGNNYVRVSASYPMAPKSLVASTTSSSLGVHWSASNATSWRCTLLYGFGAPSSFTQIVRAPSCMFSGLAADTSYGVSIVATGIAGNSSPSEIFTVTSPNRSISCARGRLVRHITGVSPRCPLGFHRVA